MRLKGLIKESKEGAIPCFNIENLGEKYQDFVDDKYNLFGVTMHGQKADDLQLKIEKLLNIVN